MFAFIDLKGATHIAINIPREGADRSIPALVAMLENNAVFIKRSWGSIETCEPEMSIQLGNKVSVESHEAELVVIISSDTHVLDESFVNEAPDVRVSYQKVIESRDTEIKRLRAKLALAEQQLFDLQDAAAESDLNSGL